MATVEARHVTKLFDDVRAVDGIDLTAKEGEFLVLLGPSGCGKTTLMRMIAGLERPTEGDIVIDGAVVTDLPPRARNIAMVFQSYALYPHLTVAKNISFPLRAVGMPKDEIGKKVERAARMFGIERFLDRKPRQLSGGERQRVALARAVVREPVVFLLDEPLSNLDAKLRNSARDELKQFQKSLATTTIYVTHDQAEAMGLGDRIAVLNQGRVCQIGTPQEIYGNPTDTFVATFIGSPPMNLVEDGKTFHGFRPEAFLPEGVEPAGDNTTFPFRITRIEYLGADRLVYGVIEGRTPEAHVISKIPTNIRAQITAGELYDFVVRTGDIQRFDRESGKRIGGRPVTAIGAHSGVGRGAYGGLADNERWLTRAMLAPAILYIVLLVGFPFLLSLYYSVSSITVASRETHFVGLENFQRVVESRTFWLSLKNTVIITVVSQFFVLVFANILAMALIVDFRGKWLVRLLILLPWVAPISLGSIGWLWIFDSIYSIINWTGRALHILGPNQWPIWLGDPTLAMASIITLNVWRLLPLATVIILAGLTSIPQDIHDAAQVDGAGFWRRHFQITAPLVLPITLVALLFGIIFTFTDMIVVFVLTRGGPYDTTQVIASWAYFTGIQGGDLAGGAAISLFLFPVLVAVAIVFLWFARRAEVT